MSTPPPLPPNPPSSSGPPPLNPAPISAPPQPPSVPVAASAVVKQAPPPEKKVVVNRGADTPRSGGGWKFAAIIFLLLFLGVAGFSGWYYYTHIYNAPPPKTANVSAPINNTGSTAGVVVDDPKTREQLAAAQNENAALRAEVETQKKNAIDAQAALTDALNEMKEKSGGAGNGPADAELRKKLAESQTAVDDLKKKAAALETDLAKSQGELDATKKNVALLEDQLKKGAATPAELPKYKEQVEAWQKATIAAQAALAREVANGVAKDNQITALQESTRTLAAELAKQKTIAQDTQTALNDLKNKPAGGTPNGDTAKLREQLAEKEKDLASATARADDADKKIAALNDKLKNAGGGVVNADEIAKLQKRISEAEASRAELSTANESLKATVSALKEHLIKSTEETMKDRDGYAARQKELQRELDAAKTQIEDLKTKLATIPETQPAVVARPAGAGAPAGKIERVAVNHNITSGNQLGMLVQVSFTASGMKNGSGLLAAWPVDANNNFIKAAANATTKDGAGNVAGVTRFSPTQDTETFTAQQLFIPYSAFPRMDKPTLIKLRVYIFSKEATGDDARLSMDESHTFQLGK